MKTIRKFNCSICGEEKILTVKVRGWKTAKYCSKKCMGIGYSRPKVKLNCKICGNEFEVNKARFEKKNPKYCSRKCEYVDRKGRVAHNKLPRKNIVCACGCGQNVEIVVGRIEDVNKRFVLGHNSKARVWNKGLTQEIDERVKKFSGKNNGCWSGGVSFEPYTPEFNRSLKNFIRKRDNHTCQECKHTEEQLGYKLCIHHIDYNKKNNDPKNLIGLCRSCHGQTQFNRNDWVDYYKEKVLCQY